MVWRNPRLVTIVMRCGSLLMMQIPALTWVSAKSYVYSQFPKHILYFSYLLELTNRVLWYSVCPQVWYLSYLTFFRLIFMKPSVLYP